MGSEVIYWRHLAAKNDLRPHFLLGGGRCARAHREARDLRGDEARLQAAARERIRNSGHRRSRTSRRNSFARASWLRARLQKQVHEVGEAKKRVDTYRAEWAVERDIARIVSGSDPIIVGPWLSEVGLRGPVLGTLCPVGPVAVPDSSRASGRRDARRRGSPGIATSRPTRSELFDLMSPDEYAARQRAAQRRGPWNAEAVRLSHRWISDIVADVEQRIGIEPSHAFFIRRLCISCFISSGLVIGRIVSRDANQVPA